MTETGDVGAEVARQRAASGIALLSARTVVVQLATFAGTVVLARLLSPEEFGAFAVLQFALGFLQFFGDAGVGGALIQARERPSERALASVFTLQLALAVGVVAAAWLGAPYVLDIWPALPPVAPLLLRAMALAFLITSIRVVPSILLERELRFAAIAASEVVQALAFYAAACACAAAGLGLWTWPVAVLTQGMAGLIVVYAARPWRPRLALDGALLRPLVRFGIPFQVKNFIGFANGAVTPLYAGAVLGPTAVGLINWGQQIAYLPLKLVEVVARISFPLFSRIQYQRDALARVLERTVQFCALGAFFSAAVLLTAGRTVTVVVFSEKWVDGLVSLYAFSAVLLIGFFSPVVAAVMDALGKPAVIARLAAFWTLLNWMVVPVTTWRFGMNGFVLGYCVHVVVGNLLVLYVARKEVPEARLLRQLVGPALGALAAAVVSWTLVRNWGTDPVRLAVSVGAALTAQLAIFAVVDRQAIAEARQLLAGGARAA